MYISVVATDIFATDILAIGILASDFFSLDVRYCCSRFTDQLTPPSKQEQEKKKFEKTSWFKSKNPQKITQKISKKYQNSKKNQKTIPKVKSVLFVPRSTGSKLCKMLRAEEQKLTEITGYRIKVVERSGDQIRRILCKKDPFEGAPCGRETCMVCKPEGKGNCRRRNITYQTTCDNCEKRNQEAGVENTADNVSKYVGEENR